MSFQLGPVLPRDINLLRISDILNKGKTQKAKNNVDVDGTKNLEVNENG